jgi:site-specific recombinase XerD
MLKKSLNAYLDEHAYTRVNGRVASHETATRHGEALRANFGRLHELGFKLTDAKNLGERHLFVLCQDYYDRKLAPKTISGYLSHLRIFSDRIGKKGLVKKIYYYLPKVPKEELRVSSVAKQSKSWHEAGIDVPTKILEANAIDPRFRILLTMQVAFGLRRKEALMLKPWVVDQEDKLAATQTKGNRPRSIYIDTPEQRWALEQAKAITKGKNDTLGWYERHDGKKIEGKDKALATYKYSKNHYNYLMQKIGITKEDADCTGHGLRAQYAENSAILQGLIPATLGGTPGQMPKGDRDVIQLKVSESLGHSRLSVTGAYVGSYGRDTTPDASDVLKYEIQAGLDSINEDQLKDISEDRNVDCACLSSELTAIKIYADPRKIQFLWEDHSRRNAVEWVSLNSKSNLPALKVAATSIMRAARS